MAKSNNTIVAVDIDEVLQPLHAPFLAHQNNIYGTDFQYPDGEGRYYLEQFTGESSEVVEEKLKTYVESAEFKDLKPLPGAIQAIEWLKSQDYTLVVITARQHFFMEATHNFLDSHFPRAFDNVRFIDHYVGAALKPADAKLEICKEVGAEILIDDNIDTARAFASTGKSALLFGHYHWNKDERLPDGVIRCADWSAVKEYFEARE